MIRGRLYGLDIFRFLLAVIVMAFHYLFRGPHVGNMPDQGLSPVVADLAQYGYLAVFLFFMISGYVIAFSAQGQTPAGFAIARFSRIYPTFILCMSLSFGVILLFGAPVLTVTLPQFLANFAVLPQALGQTYVDGVYWSIVREIVFYGWTFLLLATGLFHTGKAIWVTAWLVLSCVNETWLHSGLLRFGFLTDYSGFFAAGIALHMFHMSRNIGWLLLFAVAAAFGIYASVIAIPQYNADMHTVLSAGPIIVFLAIGTLAFWGFTVVPLARSLYGLAAALGGLSYPLYLLHENIGFVLFNRSGLSGPWGLAAVAVMMISLAWLFWLTFDRRVPPVVRRWLGFSFQFLLVRARQGLHRTAALPEPPLSGQQSGNHPALTSASFSRSGPFE
jgi:peptidoglycan/LPS O-acetylase OafA/YrhL